METILQLIDQQPDMPTKHELQRNERNDPGTETQPKRRLKSRQYEQKAQNKPKQLMNLPETIQNLLSAQTTIHQLPCRFEATDEAANHNWKVLTRNGFNLTNFEAEYQKRSVMSMGSKFKSTLELRKLLSRHPRWNKMKQILEKGVNFELEGINEEI